MDKIYIRFRAVIYVYIQMIAIVTRRKGVVPENVGIGLEWASESLQTSISYSPVFGLYLIFQNVTIPYVVIFLFQTLSTGVVDTAIPRVASSCFFLSSASVGFTSWCFIFYLVWDYVWLHVV